MCPAKGARIFISDCEGPISKNDNAFEITEAYLPRGAHFYSVLSKYDDLLAHVAKRPGYKAGYTLKLIPPFLKAYGVSDNKIAEHSSQNIDLMPGSEGMLRYLNSLLPSFIVSTSYQHYIASLCTAIGFPVESAYCTTLNLDGYHLHSEEAERLRSMVEEVSTYPIIRIPVGAQGVEDLSTRDREVVRVLDKFFWEEISEMECGRILEDVEPLGGEGKAEAVEDIIHGLEGSLNQVVYVGDSITDVEALSLVKEGGGLSVSFNGNRYAVENAEVAVLSETAAVTAILVDAFHREGRDGALRMAEDWSRRVVRETPVDKSLSYQLLQTPPEGFPRVSVVDEDNVEGLIVESGVFRKKVRGEAVGRLG